YGDRCRRTTHLLADPGDDAPEEVPDERLCPVRRSAEDDRRRVAQPTLELAGGAERLGQCAALGRLADEDLAVGAQDDYRRNRGRPFAELEDLEPICAGRRSGRIGRAEIDPERVIHEPSSASEGSRVYPPRTARSGHPEGVHSASLSTREGR